MDTHIWTCHRETGSYWHCPTRALDDMRELGWEPSEAPPDPIPPAVAERVALARRTAEGNPTTTARQVSRRTSKEMTDG